MAQKATQLYVKSQLVPKQVSHWKLGLLVVISIGIGLRGIDVGKAEDLDRKARALAVPAVERGIVGKAPRGEVIGGEGILARKAAAASVAVSR